MDGDEDDKQNEQTKMSMTAISKVKRDGKTMGKQTIKTTAKTDGDVSSQSIRLCDRASSTSSYLSMWSDVVSVISFWLRCGLVVDLRSG